MSEVLIGPISTAIIIVGAVILVAILWVVDRYDNYKRMKVRFGLEPNANPIYITYDSFVKLYTLYQKEHTQYVTSCDIIKDDKGDARFGENEMVFNCVSFIPKTFEDYLKCMDLYHKEYTRLFVEGIKKIKVYEPDE